MYSTKSDGIPTTVRSDPNNNIKLIKGSRRNGANSSMAGSSA